MSERPRGGDTAGTTVVACAILALAAGLRLWSISAGAPFRLGVDEPFILNHAVHMMKSGDFNPHFFDYGGLTLYLQLGVACVTFILGAMSGLFGSLAQFGSADLVTPARIVTAWIGVLTVLIVYRAALRWGAAVALLAAFALAIHPQHVRESHFALTDVPLTFLVAVTWLLSIRAAEDGRARAFFWAGLTAGLAAATKYNGGVALIMPMAAGLIVTTAQPRVTRVTAAVGGAAVGFLAAAPYSLLALPEFLDGFAGLARSYNTAVPFQDAALTYLKHFRNWHSFPGVISLQLGWIALLVGLLGLAASLWQERSRQSLAIGLTTMVFPVVYFWLIAGHGSLVYGRYALPMAPMMSFWLGLGVMTLGRWIGSSRWPRARLGMAALGLIFVPPLSTSISWDLANARVSTVDQAREWIAGNVRPAEGVAVEDVMLDLPRARLTTIKRLTDRPFASYESDGIVYLVTTSQESHQQLIRWTHLVQVFRPSEAHPGPTITVLRVPTTSATARVEAATGSSGTSPLKASSR